MSHHTRESLPQAVPTQSVEVNYEIPVVPLGLPEHPLAPEMPVVEAGSDAVVIDMARAGMELAARRRLRQRVGNSVGTLVGLRVAGDSVVVYGAEEEGLAPDQPDTIHGDIEQLGRTESSSQEAEMGLFSRKKKIPKRLSRYQKEVLRGKVKEANSTARDLRRSVGFGNKDVAEQKEKAREAKAKLKARRNAKRAKRKARAAKRKK